MRFYTENNSSSPAVARQSQRPDNIFEDMKLRPSPFIVYHDGYGVNKGAQSSPGVQARRPHQHKQDVVQRACILDRDPTGR